MGIFEAVVFDMDGILFDTEKLVCEVWDEVAEEANLANVRKVLLACIGRNHPAIVEIFLAHYGQDFAFDYYDGKVKDLVRERIAKHGVPMKAGVKEILTYFKDKGYKIGLASSSYKEKIVAHLKSTGLEKYFEVVVAGNMVEQSKPHPEIYQIACKQLGVDPAKTICIEDSINGIKSGYGAGLRVFMVPDLLEPTEEVKPMIYQVCRSLTEVKDYLEGMHIICDES